MSFLNFQFRTSDRYYSSPGASAWSLLKLSGLYFLDSAANRTAYQGGALSYGGQRFGGRFDESPPFYSSDWDGRGCAGRRNLGGVRFRLARPADLETCQSLVHPGLHLSAAVLDTVAATIDAPPAVVEKVAGRILVLLDGGVRRGTDVLKALARSVEYLETTMSDRFTRDARDR